MNPEKRLPLALSIAVYLWEAREHLPGGLFPVLVLSKPRSTGKLLTFFFLESSYCAAVFHGISISYVFSCKSNVIATFLENMSVLSFKQPVREKALSLSGVIKEMAEALI